MWPFKRTDPQQPKPPTAAAIAVARSLREQPQRWSQLEREWLQHDSGIIVDMLGYISSPDLEDEPDANSELVAKAIDEWVAATIADPPRPKKEVDGASSTEAPCVE